MTFTIISTIFKDYINTKNTKEVLKNEYKYVDIANKPR